MELQTPPLRILLVDADEASSAAAAAALESAGHAILRGPAIAAALDLARRHPVDIIFFDLDVDLAGKPFADAFADLLDTGAAIVAMSANLSAAAATQAMVLGAVDVLSKPIPPLQLLLAAPKGAMNSALARKLAEAQRSITEFDAEAGFATSNPLMCAALQLARRAATANAAILLHGPAGSGRGRIARAIHEWSPRAAAPFIPLSIHGHSAESLELALFGAVPGARGASQPGAASRAHRGTLFLDGIDALPMPLQPRVLALLRDKEFEPVDSPIRRGADVRIIASAGPSLEAAVRSSAFRADLHDALNIVRINVPSLKDRAEDLPLLAERCLAHFAREHHRSIASFSRDAMFILKSHTWPGNCRELRNAVERAVLRSTTSQVTLRDLPSDLVNAARPAQGLAEPGGLAIGDLAPLDAVEGLHIMRILAAAGTVRRAATILGINPSTLVRKLRILRPANFPAPIPPTEPSAR